MGGAHALVLLFSRILRLVVLDRPRDLVRWVVDDALPLATFTSLGPSHSAIHVANGRLRFSLI